MSIQEHKAQTKSDRLIDAMDRLSSNLEVVLAMPSVGVRLSEPYVGLGGSVALTLLDRPKQR